MKSAKAQRVEFAEVLDVLSRKSRQSMLGSLDGKDPYYILISTVLSARNRDVQTLKSVNLLFSKYKTARQIALAPLEELEPLLRQTGFYRTKARRIKEISSIIVKKFNGRVPDNYEELMALPGVGRKTAGCVLVYAFGRDAIPVDTHVHRVANRLGWVKTGNPLQTEEKLLELVPRKHWRSVNEALVIHGQETCNSLNPKCSGCPVINYCCRVNVKKSS